MGILIAFIASILTVLLGLGFTGLTKRLTLFRGAGVDGPSTRVTLPTPDVWEAMTLSREGLLPWPSEVEDGGIHFQPLPWPSSLWPEPFVTRSEAELLQQQSDNNPQTRHTAPRHAPMQDHHPKHDKPSSANKPKQKQKQKQKQKGRPQPTEDDFFDAPLEVTSSSSAPPAPDSAITPDMVRSWVGMYGLAGAVERYRTTTGREFSQAAKEIAEILRR